MRPDDKGLMIRFFSMNEKNEARSTTEGRDIFDELECISIRVPGSRDEMVSLVNDEYRSRFADEYKGWKRDQSAPISGTPLEEWPAAGSTFIDEMRMYGVRTVEQLAGLSDGTAMVNPGWVTMRTRAQAFLQAAQGNAAAEAAAVENAALKQQMAAMQAQMDRLMQGTPPTPPPPEPAPAPAPDPLAEAVQEAAAKKR